MISAPRTLLGIPAASVGRAVRLVGYAYTAECKGPFAGKSHRWAKGNGYEMRFLLTAGDSSSHGQPDYSSGTAVEGGVVALGDE